MDIIDNIVDYFKNKGENNEDPSPKGTCSVCWGYQQYDGKIRELLEDKQIDINNHKDTYMIIQEFMKEHVEGVKLKEGVVTECPNCAK
jgi:hypothetical protein